MARDIYIKPDDDAALRYAAEQQMAVAKQGGPLEQVLGYASKIPGALKEEQKARAKRAALSQFMAKEGKGVDVPIESAEELARLAQAQGVWQKPDIEEAKNTFREQMRVANEQLRRDLQGERQTWQEQMAVATPEEIAAVERQHKMKPGSIPPGTKRSMITNLIPQPMPAGAASMSANMNSGLMAIKTAKALISGPRGWELQKKVGSPAPRFASIGDKDAQRLRKAIVESADVLTRGRTGAQLNEQEMSQYTGQMIDWFDDPEVTMEVLNNYENFYKNIKANIESGRFVQGDITPTQLMDQMMAEIAPKARAPKPGATQQRKTGYEGLSDEEIARQLQ